MDSEIPHIIRAHHSIYTGDWTPERKHRDIITTAVVKNSGILIRPRSSEAFTHSWRYNRIDDSKGEFSMAKFAIGEKVDNAANDREGGTVIAVFSTVDGSFRYAVDTEGYGALQFFTEEKLVVHPC
jgi:hypothetical protein